MTVVGREAAKLAPRRQQRQQIHDAATESGRRLQPLGADHLPHPIHRCVEAMEIVVVPTGEAADGGAVMRLVAGHQQRAPVLEDAEIALHPHRLIAVAFQLQLFDHLRPQQAYGVGSDGVAVAGMEFLCHRRAAQHGAPLQHQDF